MNKLYIIFLLAFASCSKSNYNATFTGFEFRKCLCCGGYEVTLDNGEKVIGVDVSETLGDQGTKIFPFQANISYAKSEGCSNIILIKKIELK